MSTHSKNLIKAIIADDKTAIKQHFESSVKSAVATVKDVEKTKIANSVFGDRK